MSTNLAMVGVAVGLSAQMAWGQATPGASRITMDEAIGLAVQHNHALQAARTTIDQSKAQEITAGLRPNPILAAEVQTLPLYAPKGGYFDQAELDLGLSYQFELGGKRGRRLQAARDATAVTRDQVADNERTLMFQVASQFIGIQLAESTLELARENLKSFQESVGISEDRYRAGNLSENDYLKIKLQLLQFQNDIEQAQLARVQALSDLRQLVGYESVSADYDVAGAFEYRPSNVKLDDLVRLAAVNRPDLQAAKKGVTAAQSQHSLADANGVQDLTVAGTYSRIAGVDSAAVAISIPLPFFDHNQGEIARTRIAVRQAEQQEVEVTGRVRTDVTDAYEALQRSERIVQYYRSGYLDVSLRSREISEYAYRRGATSLFDFLDAERSYRATELGYRQALAEYLMSIEQVRQSVGTRQIP